jgi:hypothetical protein
LAQFHHPRPALADAIIRQLTPDPLMGALSGLYLAAPRRTGKTTFLRRDLVPAILEAGKFPILVDLWEDRVRDPADILRRRLGQVLDELGSAAGRKLEQSRINRVGLFGFSVGLSELKPFDGTLSEGVGRIAAGVGRDVVLIVDEAQQALSTEGGMDAMFALKAARDAMNIASDGPCLFLVMTGSHRGKLSELVLGPKAPFYGGAVRDFPVLGRDFVEALIGQVNASRAEAAPFDVEEGVRAFGILMHRPELFLAALRDEAFAVDLGAGAEGLVARAAAMRGALWQDLEAAMGELTDLQRAMLEALMEEGDGFAPFAAATLAAVARRAGQEAVSKTQAQSAMRALVAKELVWQPGTGRYAIDNLDMLEMHRARGGAGPA